MSLLNDPTEDPLVDASTKGIPVSAGKLRLSEIGSRGWNVLAGDCPLPLAVISQDALRSNSAWMASFARLNGVRLAPHGKTTMAPALFKRQLNDGAWAMTIATVQQMNVCLNAGVRRIVLANQPIGQAVDACFAALTAYPDLELYTLADSLAGVHLLTAGAARSKCSRSLSVLVEIGAVGGRAGCRSVADAIEVASAIARSPGLALAGLEAFEGVLTSRRVVTDFLHHFVTTAHAIDAARLFVGDVVLSAGGSAYFDLVTHAFESVTLSRPVIRVLRSGCYIAHDEFGYEDALRDALSARSAPLPSGQLLPAVSVWCYVQSRPEPALALLTMGKRDVGHDVGLPQPKVWYRPGQMSAPAAVPTGSVVTALNDQHAYMQLPIDSPIDVGDMISVGIAHPCTTFERWHILMLVNEKLDIVDAVRTFF